MLEAVSRHQGVNGRDAGHDLSRGYQYFLIHVGIYRKRTCYLLQHEVCHTIVSFSPCLQSSVRSATGRCRKKSTDSFHPAGIVYYGGPRPELFVRAFRVICVPEQFFELWRLRKL